MKSNRGYINVVAVMQNSLTKLYPVTGVIIREHYPNNEIPVSIMAQDLLTTYKYGWKTSYYQNTYDIKTDEVEESPESLDSLISQLQQARRKSVSLVKFKTNDDSKTTVNSLTVFNSEKVDTNKQPMFFGKPLGIQRDHISIQFLINLQHNN